jgi:hypothetical protein
MNGESEEMRQIAVICYFIFRNLIIKGERNEKGFGQEYMLRLEHSILYKLPARDSSGIYSALKTSVALKES